MAARPFAGYVERKILEIDARYEAQLAKGFATAELTDQPEPETLQCRNELDRTNWLGLILKCQYAIGLGAGDQPMDVPIRCTSNRNYAVTYADAQGRMFVLLSQAGAAQANWWRLKDLARSCPTRDALDLIDLEEGWP